VTTYQDLAVSVVGLPMEVRRTYDSIDKSSGDFGVGWKVSVVNFRVAPNRILGAGGWTQYNKSCVLGLCFTAFKNSTPRFVAVTFPDQHTEFFDFTPQGGTNLFWECTPSFTARVGTGTASTLQPVGDTTCSYTGDGNIYGASGLYSPSRFRLTTKDGRVLVLDIQAGLVSETDPFGNSLSVSSSGLTSTLGPASNPTPGPSITFTRDGQGRITDINGPLSAQHVHYGYFGSVNELQTVTDPGGNVDVYAYDPATGNLSSVKGPGNAPLAAETYDANGRVVTVSVNGGPAVTINTDPGLLQQTFTDPSGKLTTVLTYDSLGDVVQRDDLVSGQAALTSKYQYDPVGRVTDSVDAAGNETRLVYDETGTTANGNVLSVSQVNLNRTWSYQNYNSLGEPGQIERPDGTVLMTLTYDPNTGAILSTQAPGQPAATFSYLPSGELKQQVDPGGRQVNYTYDASGHVATVGDGTNPPLSVNMDSGGLLRSVTDAVGNQISYDYWPTGQLKSETNGRNSSWQYFYDSLGRLDHELDPRLAVIQYHYNALGQLDQVTDRNLAVTTYTYDIDGNLVRETRPGNDVVNYSYDPLGRVVESDNAAAHVDRSYDIAGRLQSETTCGNTGSSATPCPAPGTIVGGLPVVRISYLYTPTGQVRQVSSSDTNSTVSYTYDTNGRVHTISDPANPNAFYTYGYDTSSRLSTLQLPNGIVNNLTYGLSGDLTGIDASLNGAPVAGFDYQVDPATGRRTRLTDSAGQHSFTYNANGTLKSETHPTGSGLSNQTYTYDATGNRSAGSVTSQYDAADRLQTDGSFTYVFDGEGNLKSKTPVGGGAGTTYAWNSDHQLTSITYPDGTSSSYLYDAFGRRVKSQDPSGTTAYVYDGLDVHADYDGQGRLQKSYLPQLESVSGTSRSYYLADGLGTVRNETDPNGAITTRSAYSAWGIPASGNATGNRYTFTGYQYDQTSGLYYAGSRYYDPATGRFLSEDPQPAANSYPYAANDPVGNVDVRGEGPLVEYATFVSNALNNAECVAGVASAIATSAFSATMSALAGALVTSDQVTAAIAVGVGLSVASCAANAATSGGGKGVQANRAIGKALERKVIADLQKLGFAPVAEQLWVRTGLGWRVIDYLAIRNNSLVAFEIKTITAAYGPSQIAKDAWMARIGVDLFRNGTIYRIPTILIRG
jgi:RHS repeat-associated protein